MKSRLTFKMHTQYKVLPLFKHYLKLLFSLSLYAYTHNSSPQRAAAHETRHHQNESSVFFVSMNFVRKYTDETYWIDLLLMQFHTLFQCLLLNIFHDYEYSLVQIFYLNIKMSYFTLNTISSSHENYPFSETCRTY